MGSLEQKNSSMDQTMVNEELIKGQESAIKLNTLLQVLFPTENDGRSSMIRFFIEEILGSFSRALTTLNSGKASEAPLGQASTPPSNEQRNQNSSNKREIQSGRRSGHKRRAHPYSWTRVFSKTMDDNYTWRKYGQKYIFASKHPRSYFRCSHKYDQDCQATRQVQRFEDDPSMYVITYFGEHSCKDSSKFPHLLPPSHQRPSFIISFGSETAADNPQEPPLNPPLSSVLKQESDEEVLTGPTPGRSSTEFFMLPDLETLERSALMAEYMGTTLDQYCDVMSGMYSSKNYLDILFNTIPSELDDMFSLDEDKLFQD